jgi:threonine dehydratase
MTTDLAIQFADIEAAASRLAGVAHRTPVLQSRTANQRTRAQLFFKAENHQRMGAFKFRGAYNALSQFSADQRRAGVITFSSGNHAQAIALASRLLGIPSVIVMPMDAPAPKLAATREYQAGETGSEIVMYDRYTEDREAIGRRLAQERGLTLIPPYDHPHVMAGLPDIEVIGVEPQAGNDTQRSLASGQRIIIDVPLTIADGAQTQSPGRLTFPVVQTLVSRIATVSDGQLISTMRFFAERMKQVVEPTGCLAAAAALEGVLGDLDGARVGVIISGGNVDLSQYGRAMQTTGEPHER